MTSLLTEDTSIHSCITQQTSEYV